MFGPEEVISVQQAAAVLARRPDNADGADIAGSGAWIRPGTTLLVASTGGHLDQLHRLQQRFRPALGAVEWVTFDTPQSRHLLAGEVVHHVPFVRPKDAAGTLRSGRAAAHLLRGHRFARVISTGAAIAVPFLGEARAMGVAAHYIESAARSEGTSMSGAMVGHIPGVRLYGQYPAWTYGRWQFRGSVFDGYVHGPDRRPRPIDKVVVTFGTQRDFGFRRAVERLVRLLPEVCTSSASILWQTGATDTTGLGIAGVDSVPSGELVQAIAEADLVVSHSGVGTALVALDNGKCPTLLPRRRDHHEHTDDHQQLIAGELRRRGLAVPADPDELTAAHLEAAARMTAERAADPPRFLLQPD